MNQSITPKRHSDEEAAKPEDDLRALLDQLPVSVFILDRQNLRILECNRTVEEVYGSCREEILGSSFLSLFEESEQEDYALTLRGAESIGYVKQLTWDGRRLFVNLRISTGRHMGRETLLVAVSDVMTAFMMERQFDQACKLLILGEMVTGVAHELNQPLSVIKTASSFLLDRISNGVRPRDDILVDMLKEIDDHADRASGIIGHIREFGRKSEAKKELVHLNDVLQRAIDIFRQQLELRMIDVVKDFEKDLPGIMADSNRLEQVFINLLLNARDAIDEKRERSGDRGTIHRIHLKTSFGQGWVRIEVKDTGIGIPKPILNRIFEPFFTTKNIGKGTGLGLSISYGIVQEYSGTIEVETREDEGSTFVLQFPVQVDSNGREDSDR
jgi:histidine kinase